MRLALHLLMLSAIFACGKSSTVGVQAPASEVQPISLVPARVPLVLRGVTVIDVENGTRAANQSVVIVDNRIRTIGGSAVVRAPVGARLIDARGKYLIPGLWDMHVHPFWEADRFYPLFVANGITGVRDAGSPVPLSTLNRWKQEIAAGTRIGPRLVVAGPSINECPDMSGGAHTVCVSSPGEARLMVDALRQAGADFIKPYSVSRELYLALLAEAKRVGLPLGGHSYNISGLEASDSGAVILDHHTWFDPNVCDDLNLGQAAFNRDKCADAANRLRRNGTWVTITIISSAHLFPHAWNERLRRYLPNARLNGEYGASKQTVAAWDSATPSLPAHPSSFAEWQAAYDRGQFAGRWDLTYAKIAGMPILAATDGAPLFPVAGGFELHETLVAFVLGGMPTLEALQTATINPARALRATDSLGTVTEGNLADLVLLDADPLVDITNTSKISAVVADGRYFDRTALDALLREGTRAAKSSRQCILRSKWPYDLCR